MQRTKGRAGAHQSKPPGNSDPRRSRRRPPSMAIHASLPPRTDRSPPAPDGASRHLGPQKKLIASTAPPSTVKTLEAIIVHLSEKKHNVAHHHSRRRNITKHRRGRNNLPLDGDVTNFPPQRTLMAKKQHIHTMFLGPPTMRSSRGSPGNAGAPVPC